MMREPATVVFIHIPHTGGTSLRDVIRRQYAAAIYEAYEKSPHTIDDFIALPDAEKRDIRCFMAHVSYGIHETIPIQTHYITLLRDPVKRLLSDYTRIVHDPDHYLHAQYQQEGTTLEEHIRRARSSDIQLRQIIGRDLTRLGRVRSHREVLPEDAVEVAKAHLDQFEVAGITEEFDASLLLMKRKLGWKDVYYVRQNTSEKSFRMNDLPAATRTMLLETCAREIELYDYARQRLTREVEAQGSSFTEELRAFQAENARRAQRHLQRQRWIGSLKKSLRPVWRKLRR